MLTLLLGPDDFSKNEYVLDLAKSTKMEMDFFSDSENLPMVESLSQQDLFSTPKIYVLKGLIKQFNNSHAIDQMAASKNQIILMEDKLDKRIADNKALLSNKKVIVNEFILPHGRELNDWIVKRANYYKAKISSVAVESLAVALGRDDAKETKFGGKVVDVVEIYSLWQADSEIQKLAAFAGGKEITTEDIKALSNENVEVDVFDLTNAIADNEKQKTLDLLNKFLKNLSGSDEKGGVIQLNALLSEQFRNVAAVQDFTTSKKTENEILELTSWKSGRLFVIKKIAAKFPQKKVLEFLSKLSALDQELKTSQVPPRVLLDLIVSQLLM